MQKYIQQKKQPPQYIAWSMEQNSFIIKNPSRFSEQILPKYFKHSNLSSFIRQLNIYNFKKISNEKYPDQCIYSHSFFDKNRPELMKNIYRKVHHQPNRISRPFENLEAFSEMDESIILERKKLQEEIQLLQSKLSQLQTTNQNICHQNLLLESIVPISEKKNIQLSKIFYKVLMQSYGKQYLNFAERIQSQLVEQDKLWKQLSSYSNYIPHNPPISVENASKSEFSFKSKQNQNYNNSTSSGNSINGQSSIQNVRYSNKNPTQRTNKTNKINQKPRDEFNVNDNYKNNSKFNTSHHRAFNQQISIQRTHNHPYCEANKVNHNPSINNGVENYFQYETEKQESSQPSLVTHPKICVINISKKPFEHNKPAHLTQNSLKTFQLDQSKWLQIENGSQADVSQK